MLFPKSTLYHHSYDGALVVIILSFIVCILTMDDFEVFLDLKDSLNHRYIRTMEDLEDWEDLKDSLNRLLVSLSDLPYSISRTLYRSLKNVRPFSF